MTSVSRDEREVVIVDDDLTSIRIASHLLRALGPLHIHEFTRAADALAHCASSQPDLQFDPRCVDAFFEAWEDVVAIRRAYPD